MRALVYDQNLELKKNLPLHYTANEVLIKVIMAGICNTDIEITKGYMAFSGVPGHEFVGVVEKANNETLIGLRVTGEINCVCDNCYFCKKRMASHCSNRTVVGILNRDGAFSDYINLPEKNLHIIPETVSDEEAVFVEPLAAAFQILEQVNIKPEDRVVVLGDGKLGLLIAQVLSLQTKNLIAVGKHHNKLQILENRGIQIMHLTDYSCLEADIVIEATGSASGFNMALDIVRPKGIIVLKTTIAENQNINFAKIVVDEITVIGSRCGPFEPAIESLSRRQLDVKPLISKIFDFENVIEAFEYATKPGVMKVLLKM
jgi:threonine dehydrogenase-like Zn-dependent dehydrogenase